MSSPDPKLDLVLERVVDVPPALVWTAWTEPEHLMPWFCPAPWQAVECEIDLRPGGKFRTVMRGPEGQQFDHLGCYLEVVRHQRLVWTNAMTPGFRPARQGSDVPLFTAVIRLAPEGKGTRYVATVLHATEKDAQAHNAMGFRDGWGKALDQLVAMARGMKAQ